MIISHLRSGNGPLEDTGTGGILLLLTTRVNGKPVLPSACTGLGQHCEIFIFMCTFVYMHMFIIPIYICIYKYLCKHVCTCIYVYNTYLYMYISIFMYTCMYMHMFIIPIYILCIYK